MRTSPGFMTTKTLVKTTLALALVVIPAIDAGSVAITTLRVGDDVKDAGRAATVAIEGAPVSSTTALAAYAAADSVAADRQETVLRSDFRVNAGGSVTLTLERVAPTLVAQHIPALSDWITVQATHTHQPPNP